MISQIIAWILGAIASIINTASIDKKAQSDKNVSDTEIWVERYVANNDLAAVQAQADQIRKLADLQLQSVKKQAEVDTNEAADARRASQIQSTAAYRSTTTDLLAQEANASDSNETIVKYGLIICLVIIVIGIFAWIVKKMVK